jgi:hypothetical protein
MHMKKDSMQNNLLSHDFLNRMPGNLINDSA